MKSIVVSFAETGEGKCLWSESFDIHSLGELRIHRASKIEYNSDDQEWSVYVGSEQTPRYSNQSRQNCIDWEHGYYNERIRNGNTP